MNRAMCFAVLAMVLLAMGSMSCVKAGRMTPDEFSSMCLFPGGRDLCGDDQSICDEYQTVIAGNQSSLQECTSDCNKLQRQEYSKYTMQDCGRTIDAATDLCEQNCHRRFSK